MNQESDQESEPESKEAPEAQRKRGRKKKYVIESIKKLRENDSTVDKIDFDSNQDNIGLLENKSQISFGSLNITIHKNNPVDKQQLRKLFDNEFKQSSEEKVPSVMIQEDFEKKKKTVTEEENFKIRGIITGWHTKTDIWCHWCCHPFDTFPVPCPIAYNEITSKFDTVGVFCSWDCSAAYSIDKYNSLSHLYKLRKCIGVLAGPAGPATGSEGSKGSLQDNQAPTGPWINKPEYQETAFNVACPRLCLKVFGGSMTIEEFRKKSGSGIFISNVHNAKINQVAQYIVDR
jgi:hypothetical protein